MENEDAEMKVEHAETQANTPEATQDEQ